jgi:hypothetical protein
MARAIPVGVSIVNLNVCRLARRRGVGVSVGFSGGCAQVALGKERMHSRLVYVRGLRLSEADL